MLNISGIVLAVGVALALVLVITLIKTPIKWAFKLLLHALIGFVALFVLNFFGSVIGLSLKLTWINAIVTGVFGIPGIIVLLLIKFFL